MSKTTRRDFLRGALATGALAGMAPQAFTARTEKRTATDVVTLGHSGIQVTRLAFGTGTHGGRIQRQLGQDDFTRLVRHAYDRGIRFFETADSYTGMPEMLSTALQGIPRDSYKLMTKLRTAHAGDLPEAMDRLRRQLNSEYLDILLVHCVRTSDWAEEFKPIRDTFSEAKVKKVILAHGCSAHGLLPLRSLPGNNWLDVALLRINHAGAMMDNMRGDAAGGDVKEVTQRIGQIHGQHTGVIGMKVMGEGRFTTPEDRDASIRYVMKLGTVDAVTIGYKSTAEIDEAIERINTHLNS